MKRKTKTKRRAKKPLSVEERELASQEFNPAIKFGEGVPQPEPFLDLMRAYQVNPWSYAAVFAIASNLAAIDFPFSRKKKDGTFEDFPRHPMQELIDQPNEFMTGYDLKEATFAFLELAGNAYWILETLGGTKPREIWPIAPHLMKPVSTRDKFVDHYLYDVGDGRKIRYEPENVVHFKDFNPTSQFYGMGATLPVRNSLTLDLFQVIYNKTFFSNNARPDAILQVDEVLDGPIRKRMLKAWEAMHRGLRSAHRVALLEGGTKYVETNRSQKDMEFREGRKQNREEMLAAYGVPPIVVGLSEGVNFATAKEQYKAFWNNTLMPKMRRFQSTLTMRSRQIFLIPDAIAQGDTSKVEALRADAKMTSEVARNYQSMGIPINAIIEALDLPFDPIDGGDDVTGPLAPAPDPVIPPADSPDTPKAAPAPETKSLGDSLETAYWKAFESKVVTREEKMEFSMKRFFRAQMRRVLKAVERNQDAVAPVKGGVIESVRRVIFSHEKATPEAAAIVETIFDDAKERERMTGAAVEHIRGSYGEFAVKTGKLVDSSFAFDLKDPIAEAWINAKNFKLVTESTAGTKESISQEIVDAIEEATREGFSQSETIADITSRIENVYDFAVKHRARRIARTEVISAANAGAHEGMRQAGAEEKQWITARDGKVRDTHMIDLQKVSINEPFILPDGVQLMQPGDPAGPAEDVVNCFLPGTIVQGSFTHGFRAPYNGDCIEIVTKSGRRLSVTANHPMLTDKGFIPAKMIRDGFYLVGYKARIENEPSCLDKYKPPTPIEKIFSSFSKFGAGSRAAVSYDFDGDGHGMKGNIDIVGANWKLLFDSKAEFDKSSGNIMLEHTDMSKPKKSGFSPSNLPFDRFGISSSPIPSSRTLGLNCNSTALLNCDPFDTLRFGPGSEINTSRFKSSDKSHSTDFEFLAQLEHGNPGLIFFDYVVEVRNFNFSGHVFDLRSPYGWIISENIFSSNCRCTTIPVTKRSNE